MLEALEFEHVGPGQRMAIEFKPRMNLLAGDNGLGKTFLLDTAWWALTRSWARRPVVPHLPPARPTINYRYTVAWLEEEGPGDGWGMGNGEGDGWGGGPSYGYASKFNRRGEQWSVPESLPPKPGLVLYAQVDGGFSVWDPARNDWQNPSQERPTAYLFTASEVWEGNKLCEGLIRDWASWQREGGKSFARLCGVLQALSPSPQERLVPGELRKISLDDPKRYPTLKMPYGQEVAVVHTSAGMQRIVALAYLLVWMWQEHIAACRLRGAPPTREIIFLIDEVEAHLHPQWQRRIVPALVSLMNSLTGQHEHDATASIGIAELIEDSEPAKVQLIAATHSPLVLASLEPHFNREQDAIFHLDLVDGEVQLHEQPWAKQGDVVNWLVSETFGLQQGRSLEAERAIEAAEAWMRGEHQALPPGLETREAIQFELVRVLAGHDPFWPRWVVSTATQEQPR